MTMYSRLVRYLSRQQWATRLICLMTLGYTGGVAPSSLPSLLEEQAPEDAEQQSPFAGSSAAALETYAQDGFPASRRKEPALEPDKLSFCDRFTFFTTQVELGGLFSSEMGKILLRYGEENAFVSALLDMVGPLNETLGSVGPNHPAIQAGLTWEGQGALHVRLLKEPAEGGEPQAKTQRRGKRKANHSPRSGSL